MAVKKDIDVDKLATAALIIGSGILAYEGIHKLRELKGVAADARVGQGGLLNRMGDYLTSREAWIRADSPIGRALGWS